MALSSNRKLQIAYQAILGIVNTEETQAFYESIKSIVPQVNATDIWVGDIYNAPATNVSSQRTLYLKPVPSTNGQAWYATATSDSLDTTPVDQWVSPFDGKDPISLLPNSTYTVELYSGTTRIVFGEGYWIPLYKQGLILFDKGSTPYDIAGINENALSVKVYTYIGETLKDNLDSLQAQIDSGTGGSGIFRSFFLEKAVGATSDTQYDTTVVLNPGEGGAVITATVKYIDITDSTVNRSEDVKCTLSLISSSPDSYSPTTTVTVYTDNSVIDSSMQVDFSENSGNIYATLSGDTSSNSIRAYVQMRVL